VSALVKFRKRVIALGGVQLKNNSVLLDGAGAPTNGTSGTGAGYAGPGSLYLDVTNAVVYINTNTAASPTWSTAVGSVPAAIDGLGQLGVARVTFDTAVAANKTVAAHASAVTIPANALIVGGVTHVNTAFTSAGGNDGTIAISVESANDIQTAAAVSGAPYSTIGRKAIVPKANTPESTSILTTQARAITFTVAVDALTAGKLTLFLYYLVSAAQA
jgi:hypothetical protein